MRFTVVAPLMLLAVAASMFVSPAAQAQHASGWDTFWHNFGVSAKRMNHYPEPFIYADREAAKEPFRIMVRNGWQMQNTIGQAYFNPETQELTRAGELKVRQIVLQSPEEYRTVYVLRGNNADVTAIRVDSVQQVVARSIPSGAMPPVVETGTELRGTPGDYVDHTIRGAASSRPAPVLPTAGGTN